MLSSLFKISLVFWVRQLFMDFSRRNAYSVYRLHISLYRPPDRYEVGRGGLPPRPNLSTSGQQHETHTVDIAAASAALWNYYICHKQYSMSQHRTAAITAGFTAPAVYAAVRPRDYE